METTITVRPAAHDDIPDLAGVLGGPSTTTPFGRGSFPTPTAGSG